MQALFVFNLGDATHVVYRVKDTLRISNRALMAADGFEFILPRKREAMVIRVIVPARCLVHVSYYDAKDDCESPGCNDATSVRAVTYNDPD